MKYPYGKNVFLTGGSSGIGQATAQLLAENGYIVYAASRNPQDSISTYSGGGEIRPIKLDVTEIESVAHAAESTQVDFGILIHCAGIGIACPAENYPHEAVVKLMETNFNGVLRVNDYFLPKLRSRGKGLCVVVGSVGGIFPIPFQSHYSASKSAVDLYAMALRMELRKHGVQVSLLMPGDTNTGFTGAREYIIEETSPYYNDCVNATQKMEKDELGGRPAISSARAILRLCGQKRPPARKSVGFDYKFLVFLKRILPYSLIERILASMYIKN
jgi:short-subunit dehydrogenase